MFNKIVFLIILLLVAVFCYYYGQNVAMKEQMPIFDGLRNTSSIIFGVMGAWLAILHPSSLKKIFSKEKGSISKEDKKTINLLLLPIIISTFILLIVLVAPLCVAASRSSHKLIQYVTILRGLSFSLLGCLTILQLWALILTLVPGDILKRSVQKEEVRQKIKDDMFSGTRQRGK